MKLVFLGTGSAMTVGTDNYHSNMLFISKSKETLMVDCGSDARHSLFKQNMTYVDIDNVYISHLHADHAGGLEWLALSRKFDTRFEKKPTLFISETLVQDIWNRTLSGGLSTLQNEIAQLDTFFDVHPVPVNGLFSWHDCEFNTVQTVHVMNGFSLMQSFGLYCKIQGMNIFITTDTQFLPHHMNSFYETADVIFHDCETASIVSGVHAHYNQLKELPEKYKKKMWLYHYNPGDLPDSRSDGFHGFVLCGQTFDFDDPDSFLAK